MARPAAPAGELSGLAATRAAVCSAAARIFATAATAIGCSRAEGGLPGALFEVELHLHEQKPEIQAAGEGVGPEGCRVQRGDAVGLPEDRAAPNGRIGGLRLDLVGGVLQGPADASAVS